MCKLHTNFSHHSILGWWEISFAVLAYIRVFDNGEKPCTFFVVSEKMQKEYIDISQENSS